MGTIGSQLAFEHIISDMIVAIQRELFSNDVVANLISVMNITDTKDTKNITNISSDRISKQIQRNSIPAKYFEAYVCAWLQIREKPRGKQFELMDENTWLIVRMLFITTVVETIYMWRISSVVDAVQWPTDANMFDKLATFLSRFLKELSDVRTLSGMDKDPLFEETEKSFSLHLEKLANSKADLLQNGNLAFTGKYPRLFHLLDENFNIFTELNPIDFRFLLLIFGGDQRHRDAALRELDSLAPTLRQGLSILNFKGGKKLLDGIGFEESSAHVNWLDCEYNIKGWRKKHSFLLGKQGGEIDKAHHAVFFTLFLSLIWPKDGADDTAFDKESLMALITFKYLLSEEARQKLHDKFFANS